MLLAGCPRRMLSLPSRSWKHRRLMSTGTAQSRLFMSLDNFDLSNKDQCNVPPHILEKVSTRPKLHLMKKPIPHPLYLMQAKIVDFFRQQQTRNDNNNNTSLHVYDDLNPIVTTAQNFDSLLIPKDHVSRSDTYYLDDHHVLRCHTSAHQLELLKEHQQDQANQDATILMVGDVYRKDEIDATHYPVFHQMEGIRIFGDGVRDGDDQVVDDLQSTLQGLARHVFGNDANIRWNEDHFPFTNPSFELEVEYQGNWLEVLGCGAMQPAILESAGYDPATTKAWAFGLGLERWSMRVLDIPDIRLFWSTDDRFWKQWKGVKATDATWPTFQPYSKYPPCTKDISFWLDSKNDFVVNDLFELVRSVGGDLIESVVLVDDFVHPKTSRISHCYRISYRSMDRSLTNAEIDVLQERVRELVAQEMGVELR